MKGVRHEGERRLVMSAVDMAGESGFYGQGQQRFGFVAPEPVFDFAVQRDNQDETRFSPRLSRYIAGLLPGITGGGDQRPELVDVLWDF